MTLDNHHKSWPLFKNGQEMIIDLSRTQQWQYMFDKKYIVAPQRYAVARFVTDSVINNEKFHVLTLYSSAHMAYIMTLPIPVDFWQITTAPQPFYEHKTIFLSHARLQQYDIGRPISVEFLHKPQEALKRLRSLDEDFELLVKLAKTDPD